MSMLFRRAVLAGACAIGWMFATSSWAAPSAEQALQLKPIQKDVDYDKPAPDEVAKCTIKAEKIGGQTGWVVRNPAGEILRVFLDTNGDNVVDRWSYYKDGVEVYRDIDENFNGKADQCRWLNSAGTRWGIDKDEDGKIDYWKVISAEEVTAEVVMALRDKDQARFERLLLTSAELKSLGLGQSKTKELSDKISAAPAAFKQLIARQKLVSAKTTWQYFGASKPGIVPGGTPDFANDLLVYEDVMAMIETGSDHGQMQIGSMVKVGDCWRLIDVPKLPEPGSSTVDQTLGFWFRSGPRQSVGSSDATAGPSAKLQKLLGDLEKIDKQLENAQPEQMAALNDQRADLQEQLAEEVGEKDRPQFIRQLADTLSAAAQSGNYPGGVDRLKTLFEKLAKNGTDDDLTAYTKFRYLSADNAVAMQTKDPDFTKIQKQWIESLEQFTKDYPKAADAAEARLQLGIAEEFAGQDEKAKVWYNQIVNDFPNAPSYKKAAGALRRIDSVGHPLTLTGKSINPKAPGPVDLSKLKNKVVLIHYWATWCGPCKVDFALLKELKAKYGKDFELIGINIDERKEDAQAFLASSPMPWPQLREEGGLESPYATDLGILTLPTMILIDSKGNVANRSIHITELDKELRALIK